MFKLVVILSILGSVLGLPAIHSVPNLDSRIVGGEETDIARNPWQLALLYYNQHFCGAVAIHPDWAITVAHCLEGVYVDYLSIRAGSSTKSSGGQVINVERIHIHPDFNTRLYDYDFALLELAESITVQPAAPATLPEPNSIPQQGALATITGWGQLTAESESTTPEILHVVALPVISNTVCSWYYYQYVISDRMMCTGDIVNGGRDACYGDAGGPVIVNGRLVGLVSWGKGCALASYPGVHASVSSVLTWIYDYIG